MMSLLRFFGVPKKGLAFWEIIAIVAFVVGVFIVSIYSITSDWTTVARRFGLLMMIGGAAWTSGSLFGFLFGVPRFKADSDRRHAALAEEPFDQAASFLPNTNLEQISDWLTKIIVGATLVQLGPIVGLLQSFSAWTGAQLREPSGAAFCGAAIIYFAAAGFMWGYLWCSVRVFREMMQLTLQLRDERADGQPVA
jgi:hypothetical protein